MARGALKTDNEYQRLINPTLYADIPKAVLAAIALSALMGDDIAYGDDGNANARLVREWDILNRNGIVPQKPSRWAMVWDDPKRRG